MHLPKRILVAVDFSETSERALDYAIELAALLHAEVTVLHAYEFPVLGFPDGVLIASGEVAGKLANAAQSGLDKMVLAREGRGAALNKVLREDAPWRAVVTVADEIDADLIVIGTHGRRGLARALLGSVAENVIRVASRPVLTIHGPRGDH
jgi:nucleotide-binding universal stress UspA family protein